jgi:NAD(P)-dependent dehydrogenase (short-subunit alcohol dehydrogenase family)
LLNGDGLGLLINNAGVLTPGPMEVLSLSAVRHEFEVNVVGSLATIHAFLPLLRQAKGRIVQIGSMTGRFPLPFSGPSSASKAAMEAFADVYRTELKPFGIDFIMVQPGSLLTGGPAKTAAQLKQVSENMTVEQKNLYGKYFDQFAIGLNKMQAAGLPSSEAAARVIEISEQVPAPIRVPVGKDAEELLRAVREKSDEELDTMKAQILGFVNDAF